MQETAHLTSLAAKCHAEQRKASTITGAYSTCGRGYKIKQGFTEDTYDMGTYDFRVTLGLTLKWIKAVACPKFEVRIPRNKPKAIQFLPHSKHTSHLLHRTAG